MTAVKFAELNLSPEMHRSIRDMGFEDASPIQAQAIPLLQAGQDIIGQAHTGTGKTAAFAIPLIEKIDSGNRSIQGLILCPTRELALQVTEEIKKLLKHHQGISVVTIYGGDPIGRQMRALAKNPQIVVGTTGRLLDHFRRGSIRLNKVKTVILDEADEMLDMGFRDDIETILKSVPRTERQVILFSATMSRPIMDLAAKYQQNPQHIKIEQPPREESKIEQLYVEVQSPRKLHALTYLIDSNQLKLALIFCNTKRQVDDLVESLRDQGYPADGLHGGLSQPRRDKVMNAFRKGTTHFLIATDVAARGIDVRNLEAVFNYDMPQDMENYVHRIGRTGRAGRSGKVYSFIERRDFHQLKKIRRFSNVIKQEIPAFA